MLPTRLSAPSGHALASELSAELVQAHRVALGLGRRTVAAPRPAARTCASSTAASPEVPPRSWAAAASGRRLRKPG